MLTVFSDSFNNMQVGAFPYNYTAVMEYHMYVPEGYMGHWAASTNHSSWRMKEAPAWNILVDSIAGGKVMEQGTVQSKGLPTITAGDDDWTDVVLTSSLRPLAPGGPMGILFRYQTSRHHYALRFTESSMQFLRNNDTESKVLAETPCRLTCDQYQTVEIEVKGTRFRARVGDKILETQDSLFCHGKIGLMANIPARFASIEVRMDPEVVSAIRTQQQEREADLQRSRQELPQTQLWRRIPTPGFGAGKSIRFGDLNHDGRSEILLIQNVRRMAKDSFTEISCVTAMDLDGRILWQIGEPNPKNALVSNDVPIQIHDIDGDGHQEVILCKDFTIQVLDGASGHIKYQSPTPINPETEGFYRVNVDALYFCDLSGDGQDNNLILKDRYNNVWAYTWDLQPLWHQQGNVGHYPMAYDVDGDGCDELLVGYNLIDQDGTLLWRLDVGDHADGVALGHFGGDDLKLLIAASDEGLLWVTRNGEIQQQIPMGHCQTVTAANLIPEREGVELATITFWGNPGIFLVYDPDGNLLTRKELISPWGSALSPVNWTGDGQEHILLWTHPTLGGLLDGHGRRVLTFPDDGHPTLCCEPIDLTGDNRDEIVTWDQESLWIYTQTIDGNDRSGYAPKRQAHYNMSNYRAQISLPPGME